ncbi:hypothetical protein ANN_00325 [Periplaneta americana]|uniref:SPIN-DOC-like zinc-finger domain-containing protein n=1 Tax=Periplaneta americana TaxID=6978 RepID=A0ABQ8TQG1_PERAM|nr:hypothetical protein ANN_00325 [Periplaneta americana]
MMANYEDGASDHSLKRPATPSAFNVSWEGEFFLVESSGLAKCLICHKTLQLIKKFNIQRHYSLQHATEYDKYVGNERHKLIQQLKMFLSMMANYEDGASDHSLKWPATPSAFNVSWGEFFLVESSGLAKCLICHKTLQLIKKFNIQRHYSLQHATEYDKYVGNERHKLIQQLKMFLRSHVVLRTDGRVNNPALRLATHGQGGGGGGGCTAGSAMSSVMVAHSGSESLSSNNNNNNNSFHVNNNDPSPGDLALLAKLEEANRSTRRTWRRWFQDLPAGGIYLWELHVSSDAAGTLISRLCDQRSVAPLHRWRLVKSCNRWRHVPLVENAADSGT